MKSKLIPIPYTIGIIKPHLAVKDDKVSWISHSHARPYQLIYFDNRSTKSCRY